MNPITKKRLLSLTASALLVAIATPSNAQDPERADIFRPHDRPVLEHVGPYSGQVTSDDRTILDANGWRHEYTYNSSGSLTHIELRHDEGYLTLQYLGASTSSIGLFALDPDGVTVHLIILFRTGWTDSDGSTFVGSITSYNARQLHDEHGDGVVSTAMAPKTYIEARRWGGENSLWETFQELGPREQVSVDERGRWLISGNRGLLAWDFSSEMITSEEFFSDEDIAATITRALPDEDLPATGWQITHVLEEPGGSMFLLARVGDRDQGYSLLLQIDGEGVRVRHLISRSIAFAPGNLFSPLYDASLDAVVIPVQDGDYLNYINRFACDGTHSRIERWRGFGLLVFPVTTEGVGYVGLTEAMSRQLHCKLAHYGRCDTTMPSFHGKGGELFVQMRQTDESHELFGEQLYKITLPADQIDLDQDGLSHAEEEAIGSDDFERDTDGGGVSDLVEYHRGTDPTDSGDDGVTYPAHDRDAVRYSASQVLFIKKPWLPEPIINSGNWQTLRSTRGPYCSRVDAPTAQASCFAPDGAEVAPSEVGVIWSMSGTFQVLADHESVRRIYFADGREEVIADKADLDAIGILGNTVWAPVDEELTYTATEHQDFGRTMVAIFRAGEDPHVVDLDERLCDAGLGSCESAVPHRHAISSCLGVPGDVTPTLGRDLPLYDFRESGNDGMYRDILRILGVDPDSRELLVHVTGNYNQFVLAISPDGGVRKLLQQEDLHPFPRSTRALLDRREDLSAARHLVPVAPRPLTQMIETGHGDMVQINEELIIGPGDAGIIQSAAVATTDSMAAQHGGWSIGTPTRVSRIWDDTFIGDQTSMEGDAYEHVRYDTYGFDPGDVLVADVFVNEGAHGVYFERSGPRGGFAPLTYEGIGLQVFGVDVSSNGRVCIAGYRHQGEDLVGVALTIDPTDEVLFDEDGSLENSEGLLFDGRVHDCAFDAQTDDLMILQTDEEGTTLWRATKEDLAAVTASVEERWEPGAPDAPDAIAWAPRTHPELVPYRRGDRDYNVIAFDHQGRELGLIEEVIYDSFYKEQTYRYVRIERDGEPLARIDLEEDFIRNHTPDAERRGELLPRAGRSDMVVRPDGLIVVAAGNHVFVINPDTGLYGFLGTFGAEYWMFPTPLLAVYPGGDDEDPWKMTTPGTRAGDVIPPGDKNPVDPNAPDMSEDDTGDDDGCRCATSAPSSSPPRWLLLITILFGVFARRRALQEDASNDRAEGI